MKDVEKIELYVVYHTNDRLFKNDLLIPILAGSDLIKGANSDLSEFAPFIKDNTGKNISSQNPIFAEMTAHYWVWKNSDADYKGLFHYRRFLNFKDMGKFFWEKDENFLNEIGILTHARDVIKKYDLILPRAYNFHEDETIYEQYFRVHNIKDLELALDILGQKHPEMLAHAKNIVHSYKKMYTCNIFIAKKKLYNEIIEWVFDILFELEKRIDISSYDAYNQRILGFLSERLFTIYFTWLIVNNKVNYLELPVAMLYPKQEWQSKLKGSNPVN